MSKGEKLYMELVDSLVDKYVPRDTARHIVITLLQHPALPQLLEMQVPQQ